MNGWRDVTLAGVSQRVDYGYTASAVDDPSLPRFLRITDIVGPSIDWSSVPGCVIDRQQLTRYALRTDDIVVARTGATVGHAKRIRRHPESVFASYLVRFRLSPDVNPRYVGALVESQAYKDYVLQHAGGAAQPNANARVLGAFAFRLPEPRLQERVGRILHALDLLIENSRRRIELLEQMAQAIYEEWFVHFRYPGHENADFVGSPLGRIPLGWGVCRLDAACNFVDGKPISKEDRSAGDTLVYGANGPIGGTHRPASFVDCTVMGKIGSCGSLHRSVGPSWVTNNAFGVTPARWRSGYVVWLGLRQIDFAPLVGGAANPYLPKASFGHLPVVEPPHQLIDQFHSIVQPMFVSADVQTRQARVLAESRDLLLPKLVTGQIDVSDLDLDAVMESVT